MANGGIIDKIKRLAYTAALTLGVMLALPGCGKEKEEEDFFAQQAQVIDELTEAVDNNDLKAIDEIIDNQNKTLKDLKKKEKDAAKKAEKGKGDYDKDQYKFYEYTVKNVREVAEFTKESMKVDKTPANSILDRAVEKVKDVAGDAIEYYDADEVAHILANSDSSYTSDEEKVVAEAYDKYQEKFEEKTGISLDIEINNQNANNAFRQGVKESAQKTEEAVNKAIEKVGKAANNAAEKVSEAANEEMGEANNTLEYYLENGLYGGEQEDGEEQENGEEQKDGEVR